MSFESIDWDDEDDRSPVVYYDANGRWRSDDKPRTRPVEWGWRRMGHVAGGGMWYWAPLPLTDDDDDDDEDVPVSDDRPPGILVVVLAFGYLGLIGIAALALYYAGVHVGVW